MTARVLIRRQGWLAIVAAILIVVLLLLIPRLFY
jgi:hypothetical protein